MFLAATAALFFITANVAAAGMEQCADDASRFCSDVKRKHLQACLRDHAAQLSLGCSDVVAQVGQIGASCQNDALRLCGSRKLNKGTKRCLERNFDRLAPACQAYFYQRGWVQ